MKSKINITNENLKMSNENFEIIMENGLFKIKKIEKENYTLLDLKQNLINYLNNHIGNLCSFEKEIELLRIILDYEIRA